MHTNGADALAHLAARVDELEAAQRITRRALDRTWRRRLLELERDVDVMLETLAAGVDVAGVLKDYTTECRRARTRAAGGADDDDED